MLLVLVIERPSGALVRSSFPRRRLYRRLGPISAAGSVRSPVRWRCSQPGALEVCRLCRLGVFALRAVRLECGGPAGSVSLVVRQSVSPCSQRMALIGASSVDIVSVRTGLLGRARRGGDVGSARLSSTNCSAACWCSRGHRGIAASIRWLLQSTPLRVARYN